MRCGPHDAGDRTTAGTPTEDPAEGTDWLADPQYRAAVVDLLGVLAYGELGAFTRLAGDSELAPSQPLKAAVARLAVAEFRHYELLVARLQEMGVDPVGDGAVHPRGGRVPRADPAQHLARGLVKAYVGDGIAIDFYREISAYVDPSTQALVHDAMQDVGQAEFVVKVVREAIAADERVAGRLALWGRRLVGEALSQAQQVAVERDASPRCWSAGPAVPTGRAPTSPSSAGCSPASPTGTPAHPADGRLGLAA